MRTRDLLVIWIPVRRSSEIQPRQYRDTSGAILIGALRENYLATGDVQKEEFALVGTLKRNADSATEAGVLVRSVLYPVLLNRNEGYSRQPESG